MNASRRILPSIALFVVVGVGCTGGGGDGADSRGDGNAGTFTPTTSPASPAPTGPVRFEPGAYRYQFGGVVADLRFDGSEATMDVKNSSGAELGEPSLYVVDGAGTRRDGVVADAAPIPEGKSATFRVTFPEQVTEQTIGLVILLFGASNYGAFAPVPAA